MLERADRLVLNKQALERGPAPRLDVGAIGLNPQPGPHVDELPLVDLLAHDLDPSDPVGSLLDVVAAELDVCTSSFRDEQVDLDGEVYIRVIGGAARRVRVAAELHRRMRAALVDAAAAGGER